MQCLRASSQIQVCANSCHRHFVSNQFSGFWVGNPFKTPRSSCILSLCTARAAEPPSFESLSSWMVSGYCGSPSVNSEGGVGRILPLCVPLSQEDSWSVLTVENSVFGREQTTCPLPWPLGRQVGSTRYPVGWTAAQFQPFYSN